MVGKYVLYEGKPCFVRKLNSNGVIDIVETISKMERRVKVDNENLQLIEKWGVNVFNINQEPSKVKNCQYDWIINMEVSDKRVLN